MRVAAIDVGTNTVSMLIAERVSGSLEAVEDREVITRLGRGVDRTRRLDDEAVRATLEVLRQFASEARELDVTRVLAVATSAARDAMNGADFTRPASAILGVPLEIVSGAREAELTFRGATSALDGGSGTVAVIDVGGGSTELVLGDVAAGHDWAHSFDVGSVRLTERHVHENPVNSAAFEAMERDVRAAMDTFPPPTRALARVLAIAGTATTYAALDLEAAGARIEHVRGHVLTRSRLEQLVQHLAKMTQAQRLELRGLDAGRADVVLAGGICLLGAMTSLGAVEVVVSDRGVRWGLAQERCL